MCLRQPPEVTVSFVEHIACCVVCWCHVLCCLFSVPAHHVFSVVQFTSLLFQLLHLCLPSYPPHLSPYLFSLCLQSCAGQLFLCQMFLWNVLFTCVADPAMPCCVVPCAWPACLVFPPRGTLCLLLFYFFH